MGIDIDMIGQIVVFECGHTYPKNYIAPTSDVRLDNVECPICQRIEENKSKPIDKWLEFNSSILVVKALSNFKTGASAAGHKPAKTGPNAVWT